MAKQVLTPLVLPANGLVLGTTQLVAYNSNRIGVGTATPSQPLEVAGNIFANAAGTGLVMINRGATTNYSGFQFLTAGAEKWTLGSRNDSTNNLHVFDDVAGLTRMVITETTGRVGIGNTDPTELLDVTGIIRSRTRITQASTTTTGQGYYVKSALGDIAAFQGLDLGGSTYAFFAVNKYFTGAAWADMGLGRVGASFQITNDSFTFYSFDTGANYYSRFTVQSGGFVGIDVAVPGALLSLGSSLYNTKLALYQAGAVYAGFGIQADQFRIHSASTAMDFKFLDAPAGNTLMTLEGTGGLTVGGRTYSADRILPFRTRQAYYTFDGATVSTDDWVVSPTGISQNNKLILGPGSAVWDEGVASEAIFHRAHNIVLEADIMSTTAGYMMIGFRTNSTASHLYTQGYHYMFLVPGGVFQFFENGVMVHQSAAAFWAINNKFRVRIVLKPGGGAAYYASWTNGATWITIWAGNTTITSTPVRIGIIEHSGTFEIDDLEIYSTDSVAPMYADQGLITDTSAAGSVQNLFIDDTAPASPPTPYMWVETGLGDTGDDLTMWIEDGV